MKILFAAKNRWLSFLLVGVLIFLIVISCAWCFFNFKYIRSISALYEANKYEVRNRLLLEAMDWIGVCSPEAAADVWFNGLKLRNGAMQYSVMNTEMRKEYYERLEKNAPYWVTGISSPWVESYETVKRTPSGEDQMILELSVATATSTGPYQKYTAALTVLREGKFWRISNIQANEGLYPYMGY